MKARCPAWCSPSRCLASAGPAGVHRSEPFPLPTGEGVARAALWQPRPTDDMPEPVAYVELLDGVDRIAPVLALHSDRRRERRVLRAQLRNSLTTLSAASRRAA